MCLTIKSGPHKSRKDLFVVKAGYPTTKSGFTTPYQSFPMKYGKLYTSFLSPRAKVGEVYEGIHALIVSKAIKSWGYFPIPSDFDRDRFNARVVVLCKIPKGSTYYIGLDSDIVSNAMIPIEPLIFNKTTKTSIKNSILHKEEIHIHTLHFNKSWLGYIQKVCLSYDIQLM